MDDELMIVIVIAIQIGILTGVAIGLWMHDKVEQRKFNKQNKGGKQT